MWSVWAAEKLRLQLCQTSTQTLLIWPVVALGVRSYSPSHTGPFEVLKTDDTRYSGRCCSAWLSHLNLNLNLNPDLFLSLSKKPEKRGNRSSWCSLRLWQRWWAPACCCPAWSPVTPRHKFSGWSETSCWKRGMKMNSGWNFNSPLRIKKAFRVQFRCWSMVVLFQFIHIAVQKLV